MKRPSDHRGVSRDFGRLAALLAATTIVAACAAPSGGGSPQAPGGTQAPGPTTGAGPTQGPGDGGGGSLLEKAAAVEHVCELLPTDLVATIIDEPGEPEEEQFPPRCSVFGKTTAMAFWFDLYVSLGDPPAGATPISGLGTGAYLEKLAATNFTLYVGLTPELGKLAVEVNNSDGEDHTDEAVEVAKAVLAKLG